MHVEVANTLVRQKQSWDPCLPELRRTQQYVRVGSHCSQGANAHIWSPHPDHLKENITGL